MDVFIARQPIFDAKGYVYGYEILFRNSEKNAFDCYDAEYASGNALTRAFIDFGVSELTNNKKAFINFTGEFLKNNLATIFPKEFLVVEILENVHIDNEIIQSCKNLKSLGYKLAIDDFEYKSGYDELIKLVDIIKIDFVSTPQSQRASIIKKFKRSGLFFLAEKVETREEYKNALSMGFHYFQGYFFAKPEIEKTSKLISYKENRLALISLINSESPEFNDISKLIENDLAFSFDILKLVNSAYYGRISEIKSIRFALVLLGLNELKKWLYLAFISDLSRDQPEEIINICMLRGKFLEKLAILAKKPDLTSELLTLGMFSMIDLLLKRPVAEALDEMHFSESIKNVLSGKDTTGFIAKCYFAVLKYERGDFDEAADAVSVFGITAFELNTAYIDSIKWIQQIKSPYA